MEMSRTSSSLWDSPRMGVPGVSNQDVITIHGLGKRYDPILMTENPPHQESC